MRILELTDSSKINFSHWMSLVSVVRMQRSQRTFQHTVSESCEMYASWCYLPSWHFFILRKSKGSQFWCLLTLLTYEIKKNASYNFSINITPAVEYRGLSVCNICFLVQVTGKVRSVWSAYQACESQRALPARGLALSVSPIKLSFARVKNAKTN